MTGLTAILTRRDYYSLRHIESAAYFARQSAAIESNSAAYGDSYNDEEAYRLSSEHEAYVIGAILSSVAFLEATINELFSTAFDRYFYSTYRAPNPNVDYESLLAVPWAEQEYRRRARTLEKYERALGLVNKKLDLGRGAGQDVVLLTQLRNTLVHYVPETTSNDATEVQRIETQLRSKFKPNPLPGENVVGPFFPDKCLGHGCANWAVRQSVQFTDEFFAMLGVEPLYHTHPFSPELFRQRTRTA